MWTFGSGKRRDEILGPCELHVDLQALLDGLNVSEDVLVVGVKIGVDGRASPAGEDRRTAADDKDPVRAPARRAISRMRSCSPLRL
jgi:hypothetical protein